MLFIFFAFLAGIHLLDTHWFVDTNKGIKIYLYTVIMKGVIRIRKWKKDMQHNDQKQKG